MIFRKATACLPLLCALALPMVDATPAAGQALGTIRGVVNNRATGQGMPDVLVRLDESGQEMRTGVNGGFALPRLAPGRYTLLVNALGFAVFEQAVTVTAGEEARVEIGLEAIPIELDEVLASADRSFSAASSRTVRAFDLVVRPVRSAQDLLRLAPGLATAQHAGGGKAEQIFLRGFDADHGTDVAVSVDGIPVNMVSHGHGQGYADTCISVTDPPTKPAP